jgi:hypothetical protein
MITVVILFYKPQNSSTANDHQPTTERIFYNIQDIFRRLCHAWKCCWKQFFQNSFCTVHHGHFLIVCAKVVELFSSLGTIIVLQLNPRSRKPLLALFFEN